MRKTRTWWSFVFLFFCLVLLESLASLSAQAQTSGTASQNSEEPDSIGVFEAQSFSRGHAGEITRDRHLTLIGVSYRLPLVSGRTCSIRFAPEIIPVGLLSEPFFLRTNVQAPENLQSFTERKVLYGAGANPIAFEFAFLPEKKVHPFVSTHGGFIYFNRNALAAQGAPLNFTVDGRAGIEIRSRNGRRVLSVGYMFQHMGNGDIARDNPGLDSHMIVGAYNFAFH